ncbi:hypothetical protein SAY87_016138 [Trapa incisa]|uniref:Uncharacterized protein n=1 Tax=Trapa incisa TaxID=236973 RepID=A0AAN7QV74_9MYRT|nr:hypothetical protein SAY87_016138 [Trapa incisa]
MIFLNSGEIEKIGLAAKWCPSIDPMFEKSTFLCESIAKLMFPRESYPEYEGLEEAHYIYSQGQPEEGGPSTAADEAIQEDVHEARQAAVRGVTPEVALGILTSELSREPWKGKVITFSESPMLHLMEGDNLASKETDYKAIKRTFRDARYGDNAVRHTVFWKLRDLARLRWSASKTGCPCQREGPRGEEGPPASPPSNGFRTVEEGLLPLARPWGALLASDQAFMGWIMEGMLWWGGWPDPMGWRKVVDNGVVKLSYPTSPNQ